MQTECLLLFLRLDLLAQLFQFLEDTVPIINERLEDGLKLGGKRRGEFRIFRQIYLPLALPGLAVLAILTFQAGWNSFLWPLIALNDPNMMTVQVGLATFINEHQTAYGPLMAATVLASLPLLLIFAYAQRHIIQSFATSGIK